jgi:putative Mg2+ transporter-C (MgtC) family protein
LAAQVISGIGFLGAGIIIFRKNTVRGLTTAASIWAVAAIGLAVGSGLYIVAIGATAILSIILTTLKKVEKRFFPQRNINTLVVEFKTGTFNAISDQLKKEGIKVLGMNVRTNRGINILKVDINAEDKAIGQLFQEMRLIKGVDSVSYRGRILSVDDWVSEEAEESEEDMPIVSE